MVPVDCAGQSGRAALLCVAVAAVGAAKQCRLPASPGDRSHSFPRPSCRRSRLPKERGRDTGDPMNLVFDRGLRRRASAGGPLRGGGAGRRSRPAPVRAGVIAPIQRTNLIAIDIQIQFSTVARVIIALLHSPGASDGRAISGPSASCLPHVTAQSGVRGQNVIVQLSTITASGCVLSPACDLRRASVRPSLLGMRSQFRSARSLE